MLVHPGMVGRALQRVVEGHLHAVGSRASATNGVEVVERAEVGVDGRVATVGARRWPRGCRGRRARRRACCSRPLRCGARRWGGSAAGTPRRSPCRRPPGAGRRAPAARPRSGGTARTRRRPAARSRSTHSGCGSVSTRSTGRGRAQDGGHVGAEPGGHADRLGTAVRRVAAASASRSCAVGAAASATVPGCRRLGRQPGREALDEPGALLELDVDVLAGLGLAATCARQVAKRSVQASTTNSWTPTVGRSTPPPTVVAVVTERPWCQAPSAQGRHRTRAARRSWPSWKTRRDGQRTDGGLRGVATVRVRGRTSSITIGRHPLHRSRRTVDRGSAATSVDQSSRPTARPGARASGHESRTSRLGPPAVATTVART